MAKENRQKNWKELAKDNVLVVIIGSLLLIFGILSAFFEDFLSSGGFGLLFVAAGVGMLTFKKWGRILGVICSFFGVLFFYLLYSIMRGEGAWYGPVYLALTIIFFILTAYLIGSKKLKEAFN